MNRSEQLYALNDEGARVLREWLYPPDGPPRAVKNVQGINYRTFARIRDRSGARWISWQRFLNANDVLGLDESFLVALKPDESKEGKRSRPRLKESASPTAEQPFTASLADSFESDGAEAKARLVVSRGWLSNRLVLFYGLVLAVCAVIVIWGLGQRSGSETPEMRFRKAEALVTNLKALRGAGSMAPERIQEIASEKANTCIKLGELWWEEWYGPNESKWYGLLKNIDDDVQRSLEWLAQKDRARAMQLSSALMRYWDLKGNNSLIRNKRWLNIAMDPSIPVDPKIRVRALNGLARAIVDEVTLAGDRRTAKSIKLCKAGLGVACAAERIACSINRLSLVAEAMRMQGIFLYNDEDRRLSDAAFSKAQALFRADSNQRCEALVHCNRSMYCIVNTSSRIEAAKEAKVALDMFRDIGNVWGENEALHYLSKQATIIPLTAETAPLVQAIEQEFRRKITLANVEADEKQKHDAWKCLARLYRHQGREDCYAECLFYLFQTESDYTGVDAYSLDDWVRLYGARLQHCKGIPGYGSLRQRKEFIDGEYPDKRDRRKRLLEAGVRMSLTQALDLAIGPTN